jgi:hypothetical protein
MQPTWPTQGVVPPDVLKNFPPGSYEYMKNGDYWEVLDAAGNKMANFTVDSMNESVTLTNKQVTALFESIAIQEGLWDQFKQKTANIVGSPEERAEVGKQIKQGVSAVAGAVAQKAQTVGKNITTKITADKLNKAWTAAGKPTDSEQISAMLKQQGVTPEVILSALSAVGIAAQPAGNLPDVSKLTPEQKQALLAELDKLDQAEGNQAGLKKAFEHRQLKESVKEKEYKKMLLQAKAKLA